MRPKPRYPVDRYLGDSSKNVEMVKITNDDLWNSEPVLRPEDEIILQKLQEMLESTAEDLKVLTQEMSKFHQPRVQVKTLPTPLDEDFNEKVHIEELVEAKFHGYKIADPPLQPKESGIKNNILNEIIRTAAEAVSQKNKINTKTQTNPMPRTTKRPLIRNLRITKPKLLNISDETNLIKEDKTIKPKVGEFSYSHEEPEQEESARKGLGVQHMPSINIRSELKEQKVLQLDILPEKIENIEPTSNKNNVVVSVSHAVMSNKRSPSAPKPSQTIVNPSTLCQSKTSIRKVTKMSPCESSSSASLYTRPSKIIERRNKVSSQTQISSKTDVTRRKLSPNNKKLQGSHKDLEIWKKRLNVVYGPSYSSRRKNRKISSNTHPSDGTQRQNVSTAVGSTIHLKKRLNNAQYIPYSQLTVGGVRASDIEREINDISDRGELPLSPILDKILSSRDNSCSENLKNKERSKILTTSDENLLQEVMDIEKKVSKTLKKNITPNPKELKEVEQSPVKEQASDEIYDDDFEDEKSENDNDNGTKETVDSDSEVIQDVKVTQSPKNSSNETFIKASNLSFKESVDVFEYVHSIDTQESSTQSQIMHKISLKETQTSPTEEITNLQPIHNDLWSAVDPKGEVERLFQLEKKFIKKLILDEYGDLVEKTIAKPSTSNENTSNHFQEKNVTASQKVTQTSPARVKSAMTSPKMCKTRTTSPLALCVKVDRHTSPLIFNSPDQELKIQLESSGDDLGISINLSSPRFSLRLPQNSREVLSNLEVYGESMSRNETKKLRTRSGTQSKLSSSSSAEIISTSELSSLGEIYRPKRTSKKTRVTTISESSSSSHYHDTSDVFSSEIARLKSDGELNVPSKSEGELEFRQKFPRNKFR